MRWLLALALALLDASAFAQTNIIHIQDPTDT